MSIVDCHYEFVARAFRCGVSMHTRLCVFVLHSLVSSHCLTYLLWTKCQLTLDAGDELNQNYSALM